MKFELVLLLTYITFEGLISGPTMPLEDEWMGKGDS
jgi:hypothetical protein